MASVVAAALGFVGLRFRAAEMRGLGDAWETLEMVNRHAHLAPEHLKAHGSG